MAGSNFWYLYECDNGDRYQAKIANHIARAIAGSTTVQGGSLFLACDRIYPELPKSIVMRKVHVIVTYEGQPSIGRNNTPVPNIWRTVSVGNPQAFRALQGAYPSLRMPMYPTSELTYWLPSRTIGEQRELSVRPEDKRNV